MTTLERLIGYPHAAVFDKAPADQLVFRLRHPAGARWGIADAVMTVSAVEASWQFDLADLTVADLVAALRDLGFTVNELSSDFSRLSALVLVEGSGDQGVSNGDRVTGYTSLMWVLMGGYAGVIREAGLQVVQALRQMIITQAAGEWLDLHGALYGIKRRQGEQDGPYAPRIPKEVFRLRESPIAIEEAVKDATGKTIRIEEPWGDIFRLDDSKLSGPAKFQDGQRIGYFFIQPVSSNPIDWRDVMPVIERNRAAGVVVLPPVARNRRYVDAGIAGTVHFAGFRRHQSEQKYEDRILLDYSLIEDVPLLNYPSLHRKGIRHLAYVQVNGWSDAPWPPIPWNDTPYLATGRHFRSYREYRRVVIYESQYWPDLVWPDQSWSDYNVVVSSLHRSIEHT